VAEEGRRGAGVACGGVQRERERRLRRERERDE